MSKLSCPQHHRLDEGTAYSLHDTLPAERWALLHLRLVVVHVLRGGHDAADDEPLRAHADVALRQQPLDVLKSLRDPVPLRAGDGGAQR